MLFYESDLIDLINKKEKLIFIYPVYVENIYHIYSGYIHIYEYLSRQKNIKILPLKYSYSKMKGSKEIKTKYFQPVYFDRADLNKIYEYGSKCIFIGLLFSRLIPSFYELFKDIEVFAIGGPAAIYVLKSESEIKIKDFILNKKNIYLCHFKLDICLLNKKSNKINFYFENDLFDLDYSIVLDHFIDYCHKQFKYKKCIFCEFDKLINYDFYLISNKPRIIKEKEIKKLKRKNIDKKLYILNLMSGPTLASAIHFFKTYNSLIDQNSYLTSMTIFDHKFKQTLLKNKELLNTRKSKKFCLNFGIETLSDKIRTLINKDYIKSKETINYCKLMLKETNINLSLNFILNIKPMKKTEYEEFKENLLDLIEYAYKNDYLDRLEFIVNLDCEYYDKNIIDKIAKSFNWPYVELYDSLYCFKRDIYFYKLRNLFLKLKKYIKKINIPSDPIREKALS